MCVRKGGLTMDKCDGRFFGVLYRSHGWWVLVDRIFVD